MHPQPNPLRGEMVALAGFRASLSAADPRAEEYYDGQLHRQVFVALEYAGPAWAGYRELLSRAGQAAPSVPDRERNAARNLASHTRLFVVDVDMDAERLRSRHPDRTRYVITTGRVNVVLTGSGQDRAPALLVRAVEPSVINAPRPFSETLNELTRHTASPYGDTLGAFAPRYEVHLRYGRFHEPWIASVSGMAPAPTR